MTARPTEPDEINTPRPALSLVFPVFDEVENLGELIDTALQITDRLTGDFEIVLVDDGSRDGSAELIDALCARHSRIRSLRHESNIGYGAALRSGLRYARGELVFFSDADLQFDLLEIEKLLEHSDRFDIVAGYRQPRRDPWPRKLLAASWGSIVRWLFDVHVRDIDCAFKLFRRHVIEAMPIASMGAFVNTEILVRAQAAGYRVQQVPVSHRRRQYGQQSGAHPRVIGRAVRELVALYRELRETRR
ncbi:MAG: glycosyltransferase family 2 protein [Myxococcota bacterium]|nr:glycosyltransferase family 2 protein [Myxococcota bacterium]